MKIEFDSISSKLMLFVSVSTASLITNYGVNSLDNSNYYSFNPYQIDSNKDSNIYENDLPYKLVDINSILEFSLLNFSKRLISKSADIDPFYSEFVDEYFEKLL